MDNEMTGLTKTFGPKVTDLKSLYGFRLLLKKRMAEYKKVLGEDYSATQAKLILWNVLDPRSKEIAMSEKLDSQDFKKLYEHIDLRYKIQYGHLNYTSTAKDDPMGLALMDAAGDRGAGRPEEEEQHPTGAAGQEEQWGQWGASLDAVGKGKSKGKGKGGACHTCGGEGHYARDCATVAPISPQSPECHGCGGRGHLKNQCPTAFPNLKGQGKGKGVWQHGGGKLAFGKNGGGFGKGGKGKAKTGKVEEHMD